MVSRGFYIIRNMKILKNHCVTRAVDVTGMKATEKIYVLLTESVEELKRIILR